MPVSRQKEPGIYRKDIFMKKTVSIFLAAVLVLGLAACGSKKQTQQEGVTQGMTPAAAPATQAAEETTAPAADMVNPMVEITDDAEFGKGLGISIDTGLLFSEAKMFIIDGRVAECQFSFENIMGENVECTLRATKDETMAQDLHGVYDSTLKEVNSIDIESDSGIFTVKVEENEAQDTTVYTWQIDDTWYSLVMKGSPSGMEVAEVMDSVMLATGIGLDSFANTELAEEAEESWYKLSEDEELLTVRLKANATTGYEWTYKIWDEGSLELVSEEYVEDKHEEGLVGVGGVWTASFKATGADKRNNYDYPCSNYVTFTYARNWEDPVPPSKVIDLNIVGAKLEILGVHEPDFSTPAADDGEYEVTLDFTNMIEENELSFYALVGIPEIITFTDEEVKNLKVGDVIPLSVYGLYDVNVEEMTRTDEKTIVLNDFERFSYRDDLGAWVIVGPDDDVFKYNREYRTVHFTNETVIDDKMEEVIKSGNSGTIYDKMRSYWHVDAKLTVKDGEATKIVIYYHP